MFDRLGGGIHASRFEELVVWQKARLLTRKVYDATNDGSLARDFGLTDQIQRAAVSVMSNIAEGFGHTSNKQFSRFLSIARASCAEVQSLLYIILDLKHLNKNTFTELYELCNEIIAMLTSLQHYLKNNN